MEAAAADHARNGVGRIEVPRNGIARQTAAAVLRLGMQRADDDKERVHEVLTDLAALVAEPVGGEQQPWRFDRAAREHNIPAGEAFDAAVGPPDEHGRHAIVAAGLKPDHRTFRPHRAAAGGERGRN